MRRTRQHPPTIQELTTDLQRMQRVQANVDRLRLEYIEEKRIQKEQELAALADVSQGREPAQRGLKGETSSALDQGPGYKIEDAVMEEVKELGSFKTDGLTVGEMEKREIELKRRQFGRSSFVRLCFGIGQKTAVLFELILNDGLLTTSVDYPRSGGAVEEVDRHRQPQRRLQARGVDANFRTEAEVDPAVCFAVTRTCMFNICERWTGRPRAKKQRKQRTGAVANGSGGLAWPAVETGSEA
jgi:hypothetical protein